MSTTRIITDTDSSLPFQVADDWRIIQVPITVHFGEEVFKTGEEIDDVQTFTRIDREGELPTTSAPSPGNFTEAYQRAFAEGADEVICFTVSGEVSATYKAALAGKEIIKDGNVTVVDTKSLSMGQGYMVLEAAKLAKQGKEPQEIIAGAEEVRDRTHLFAALSTLKYMAMSGRVGHLTAGMANLLSIKPILSIQDGKLDLLEKVRTKGKSWQRVIELVDHEVGKKRIEKMSLLHVNALDDAKAFETQIRDQIRCPEKIPYYELTPGLSVHAGSGLVGVTFVVAR
jgi:DegV family protein with EDD domain